MRISGFCVLLFSFVLLYSCSENPFTGYKQIHNGLFIQLRSIGDGQERPAKGDYLDGYLCVRSMNQDTLFFQATEVTFRLLHSTGLDTIFRMFNVGDSVSVIWRNQSNDGSISSLRTFVDLDTLDEAIIDFMITNRRSPKIYMNDSLAYFDNPLDNERNYLINYLNGCGLGLSDTKDNIYFIPLVKNDPGKKPVTGQSIKLEYTGRFLNGQVFDATSRWKDALIIEYGKPLQVIDGIETALSWMKEGEVAKIIIPSQLAFGELGSSNGTVPPYTAVVYELKLAKIY